MVLPVRACAEDKEDRWVLERLLLMSAMCDDMSGEGVQRVGGGEWTTLMRF